MMYKRNICSKCSDQRSYAEKFVFNFLEQLCEYFEQDCSFDWSERKRYDFYLPLYSIIIETHGRQHYEEGFSYFKGARTLIEEQMNDEEKKEMALHNGIEEYIVLNCSTQNKNSLKDAIMQSLLPTLLYFEKDDIDWDECDKFATKNIIFDICKDYDNGISVKELASEYKRSTTTIRYYLRHGAEYGWCSYIPKYTKNN